MTLSNGQIIKAAVELGLDASLPSVRIAYEWLDAQKKTKHLQDFCGPLKHLIESWGGRYVSGDDVTIAAHLHPELKGEYRRFNISSRPVLPNRRRLLHIEGAGAHDGYQANLYRHFYQKVPEE